MLANVDGWAETDRLPIGRNVYLVFCGLEVDEMTSTRRERYKWVGCCRHSDRPGVDGILEHRDSPRSVNRHLRQRARELEKAISDERSGEPASAHGVYRDGKPVREPCGEHDGEYGASCVVEGQRRAQRLPVCKTLDNAHIGDLDNLVCAKKVDCECVVRCKASAALAIPAGEDDRESRTRGPICSAASDRQHLTASDKPSVA